jgi:hypothetical protein
VDSQQYQPQSLLTQVAELQRISEEAVQIERQQTAELTQLRKELDALRVHETHQRALMHECGLFLDDSRSNRRRVDSTQDDDSSMADIPTSNSLVAGLEIFQHAMDKVKQVRTEASTLTQENVQIEEKNKVCIVTHGIYLFHIFSIPNYVAIGPLPSLFSIHHSFISFHLRIQCVLPPTQHDAYVKEAMSEALQKMIAEVESLTLKSDSANPSRGVGSGNGTRRFKLPSRKLRTRV